MQKFIISILCCFLALCSFSQGGISYALLPEAELYTIENGMSQTRVNTCFSDSYGFLWNKTSDGLNCNGGYNFRIYRHIPYDSKSLTQNIIRCITGDKNSILWKGTDFGLNRYDRNTEKFTQYLHDPNESLTISDNQILSVCPDKDGNNWIKTEGFIDMLYPETGCIKHFRHYANRVNDHQASLNLPQGEYLLRIRDPDNDNVWNKKGSEITVSSKALFWRSKIAFSIYLLLILWLIYVVIQYSTKSLRKSNRILRERDIVAKEVSRQKDLLSSRNKNIEDSLNYAQRIQKAMLTTPKQFRSIIPESFVFHKPKDIVSGDFYWIAEQDEKIFVAAADCTGHGVPGAFMSLISLELFRKIIKSQKVYIPADILNTMNKNFNEIFGNVEDITINDGMDLSFCVFDKSMEKLEFSGAFNPLYIVRDNNLTELKGDPFSIGADSNADSSLKLFTNHLVPLRTNDMIYMFSDGYADQFGGPEGKKYKYRRFRHLLLNIHQLPLDKQKLIIEDNIDEWQGNTEQTDDILVIGVRI